MPPHAARKGVATRQIKAGIDPELISERMDCSVKVLWEWYSRLTPEEEMERRREPFDEEYE